jgi:hypothetical protein
MAFDRINDRLEIQSVIYQYARGVDRRDWELVRSTYHADAWDDHGNYQGPIDGFIESLKKRHVHIEQSMHLLGNCLIDFCDDNAALVETYFSTYQRLSPQAGDARLFYLRGGSVAPTDSVEGTVYGRYIDVFKLKDKAWRISNRQVVFEVYKGATAPAGGGLPDGWMHATRDGNDPLYLAQRKLGLNEISSRSPSV